MADYTTWYEFKKALEKETGHRLLNNTWLGVKPAAPLPWGSAQLRSAVTQLERPGRGTAVHWKLAVRATRT
jgi:hypothetical protein